MTDTTERNDDFHRDMDIGARRAVAAVAGFQPWTGALIGQPGAYRNVPIGRYHGDEICIAPSTSASNLKLLTGDKAPRTKGKTPRHFWERSNMNPNRRPIDTPALRAGRAFHDALLLPDVFASEYHFTPEGFSRANKVKMAAEIAEADAAIAAGKCVLGAKEVARTMALVEAARANPLFEYLTEDGEAEVTLAWKDEETGVWLRSRPDWMMADRRFAMNFKTAADASYDGFSGAIGTLGYAMSAALELDGYEAVFGERPQAFLHPVVEKPADSADWRPGDYIATAVWSLPEEDIERGRFLNRQAIRTLADCLARDEWPGYTPAPEPCGMRGYVRHVIDHGQGEPHDDDITGSEG